MLYYGHVLPIRLTEEMPFLVACYVVSFVSLIQMIIN